MRILAVDDEQIALKNLEKKLGQCGEDGDLTMFNSATPAIEWAKENDFDIAFLDINMRGTDGLTLAARLKELKPGCSIVFVTGYTEYAVDAFKLKASGYLVKPIDVDELRRELDYARTGVDYPTAPVGDKRVFVQCFGNFEVFVDGKPLAFYRQKSKEIFAYLIDRKGASATVAELATVLWEDGTLDLSKTNQIHTFLHDLVKTFKEIGEEDIVIKSRNSISVDVSKIDCDFYACLNGDPAAINAYTGEYMLQYSWAEITGGKLAARFANND